jgi:hypothetical protein
LEAELNNEEFEPGASNGDVGKGNLFVGRRESLEESRMENGQAPIPRTGEGRKDKGKARDGGDDDFSWDWFVHFHMHSFETWDFIHVMDGLNGVVDGLPFM